jgi:WD40 repeat protein
MEVVTIWHSVSVDENVRVWDILTGKSVVEFDTDHGSPLTAACLDDSGKRLLTGAHDGTVKMWNFNIGAHMHTFTPRDREVIPTFV